MPVHIAEDRFSGLGGGIAMAIAGQIAKQAKPVLVAGALGGLLVAGAIGVNSFVQNKRIHGTWSVQGTFADWRFDPDGTFTEDSLIDTHAKYEVLPGNRLRLDGYMGMTLNMTYEFNSGQLFLKADNGTRYVLTKK